MTASAAQPRIALVMPHVYEGGTMRLLLNLARHLAARWDGGVVVSVPAGHLAVVGDALAALVRDVPEIEVRPLTWRLLEPPEARAAARAAGLEVGRWISSRYQVPQDGGADFADCDFWLFVPDRLEWPLVPLRPYGVFVTDFLQRYVPEIFCPAMYADPESPPWNFLRASRSADLLVATSHDTSTDAVSYAGGRGRLVLLPTTIDAEYFLTLGRAVEPPASGQYLAWVTNSSPHKNHLRMLAAIAAYYGQFAGNLDVLVTGSGTDLFDPDLPPERRAGRKPLWEHPYIRSVREAVAATSPAVRSRLRFVGSVPDAEYAGILRSARFVAHNVLADNGTFSVVEAALLGRSAVSSDYPQIREIDAAFGLGMRFFDPFDERATAKALVDGESLPPPPESVGQRILARTWRAWDDSLVAAIRETLATPRPPIACL